MKTHPSPRKAEAARHPDPRKQKALELEARSEHETGVKKERLIREAARQAE